MTETDGLVARLMNGIVEHPKRWSGDTHHDLGGSCDYEKTDKLMSQAAARLEAQSRALTASQEAIDNLMKENAELREALDALALDKIEAYRIIKNSGARSHADIAGAIAEHFAPTRAALHAD